jgi:hypothetical protein
MQATIATSIAPNRITMHVPNNLVTSFLQAVEYYSLRVGCSGLLRRVNTLTEAPGYTSYATSHPAFLDKVLDAAFKAVQNPAGWKLSHRATVRAEHVTFLNFVADWYLGAGLQSVHETEGNPFTVEVVHLGYQC